jgi:hypothetical protein
MAVMCIWIDHNIIRGFSQQQVSEMTTIYELSYINSIIDVVRKGSVRVTTPRLTLILT